MAAITSSAKALLAAAGLAVFRSVGTDADLEVEGVQVEVKVSCLSRGGSFWFNQLRPSQDWEVAVLLGLTPDGDAYAWVVPRSVVMSIATKKYRGNSGDATVSTRRA